MSCEGRVVSPSFHSVYTYTCRHFILASACKCKKAIASSENENLRSSAVSATVPSQPIVSSILMRNIYPVFALSSGRCRLKARRYFLTCLTFHRFFFIFLIITSCICIFLLLRVFSCTFEKLFTWNIMVWDKIFFFFFIDFLYLYSCSFSNRE